MDAACELAQLLDGGLGLLAGLSDQPGRGRRIALELRLGEAERHCHGDHALLSAVVQIALDPPPLGVGGVEDALAGVAQVVDAGAQCAGALLRGGFAGEEDLLLHPLLQTISRRCGSLQAQPSYTRASVSATHTGLSPPSRSNVHSTVICAPPGTSSSAVSLARIRTRLPMGNGAGNRTLLRP